MALLEKQDKFLQSKSTALFFVFCNANLYYTLLFLCHNFLLPICTFFLPQLFFFFFFFFLAAILLASKQVLNYK